MWSSINEGPDPMEISLNQSIEKLNIGNNNLADSAYSNSLEVSQTDQFVEADGNDDDEDGNVQEMDLSTSTDEDFSEWLDRKDLLEMRALDVRSLRSEKDIGTGAFSRIFLCSYHGSQSVAVKRIDLLKVPSSRNVFPPEVLFYRELGCLLDMSSTEHRNIIKLIGAARTQDGLLIATEYIPGGSLYHLVHEKRVPFHDQHRLVIANGIAAGMVFMHSKGYIHRDLTSENVLLTQEGVAKIIDFGFAIRVESSQPHHLRPAGNARWRAPEITMKQSYTPAVDVYSFGVVVNELFSLEPPFKSYERSRDAAQAAVRGIRPPMRFASPEAVKELIAKCWTQEPDMRPSFSFVMNALSDLIAVSAQQQQQQQSKGK